jgi:hypothetical protein
VSLSVTFCPSLLSDYNLRHLNAACIFAFFVFLIVNSGNHDFTLKDLDALCLGAYLCPRLDYEVIRIHDPVDLAYFIIADLKKLFVFHLLPLSARDQC